MKVLNINNRPQGVHHAHVTRINSADPSWECLKVIYIFFSSLYYKLGYIIGQHPSYFIIIPVFISILGLTGFQRIQFERDPEYLFVPSDAISKLTRESIEELFPINYTYRFDPSRITRATNFAKIYITTKDNGTMLKTKVWNEVLLLEDLIQNMTVEWDDEVFRYKDLCAMWDNKCFYNLIYNLNDLIPALENKTTTVSYPVMLFPLVLPLFFGGVEVNDTEGVLLSTRGVFNSYWLRQDTWKQQQRAQLWEKKLLEMLDSTEFETIDIARYASRSLTDELEKNSKTLRAFLPLAMLLLLGFSILSVSMLDWVRSKLHLGILGVISIIMAIFSSFGFLMYCQVPFIGINMAAPFLILGIGLDNVFIILSAWQKTNIQDPVPKRLSETYSTTAVSVTLTSLTNTLSFLVGTMSTFAAVRIFCIYLGVAIFFTYLWLLTFFGACLAVSGYQERDQRHILSCRSVRPKSQSGGLGFWYRTFCSGGINRSDPWNPEDNRPSTIPTFFRDYYAKALSMPIVKGAVIVFFLTYLGGALYGCMHIREGVDRRDMTLDNSNLAHFYQVEDDLFRNYPYRIQIVIKGNLTYSDPETQEQLLNLHDAFESLPYTGARLFTRSWIRGFYGFLKRRPALRENITSEAEFIKVLNEQFMGPLMKENLDLQYNDDGTRILTSRFIIQAHEIRDMEEDKAMIRAYRKVAHDSPLDVMVYHPTFVYYDQFMSITKTIAKTVALAGCIMMLVSFLFIPNPISSMWVGFSIISIEIGVIGFMSLWGVRLDSVAMINLIMCIGFSVDFSAHISCSYMTSTSKLPNERMQESLYYLGLPILQSGISTILGVVVFIFTPSYIYRTFFKIIFLVTVFGMMHALLLLPVMLSLTGHGWCSKTNSNSDDKNKKNGQGQRFANCPSVVNDEEKDIHPFADPVKGSRLESPSYSRESSLSSSQCSQSTDCETSNMGPSQSSSTETTTEGLVNESYINDDRIEVEHL